MVYATSCFVAFLGRYFYIEILFAVLECVPKGGHAKAIALALHSIQALVLNFVSPVPYYSRLRLLPLTALSSYSALTCT